MKERWEEIKRKSRILRAAFVEWRRLPFWKDPERVRTLSEIARVIHELAETHFEGKLSIELARGNIQRVAYTAGGTSAAWQL